MHESLDSSLTQCSCKFKVNYLIVNIPALRTSIVVVYKKPTVSFDRFLLVLTKILNNSNKTILIGDTNINIQSNAQITQYYSIIDSLCHSVLNSKDKKFATRANDKINAKTKSTTIDHVITNCFHFKYNFCLSDTNLSDHKQILLSFRDPTNRAINFAKTENTFSLKKLNLGRFRTLLAREMSICAPRDTSSLFALIGNVKKRCTQE